MGTKELVIIVFVCACSASAKAETVTVPADRRLISFSGEDWNQTISIPGKPATVLNEKVKNGSTTNEADPKVSQNDTITEKPTSASNLELMEGPESRRGNKGNIEKRETGKNNNSEQNVIQNPDPINTETSQSEEGENNKMTVESVVTNSRTQSNDKEKSVTHWVNKNPSKGKGKQNNKGKNSENDNRHNSGDEEENNRDNSYNDYDSENSEPKPADNYEDEDSAQSNKHKTSKKPITSRTNSRRFNSNPNQNRHRISSSRGKTQGRQADETPRDRINEADCPKCYNGEKTNSPRAESKHDQTMGIQGAESNILPQVENNNSLSTVLPTTETNKPSTVATRITTATIGLNITQSTLKPTNDKGKSWGKTLNIIGRVIAVVTVIGGAFYLVYSLM